MTEATTSDYERRLSAEGRKWGNHLAIEASAELTGWLDHPSIHAHYGTRCLVEDQPWRKWVQRHLGGPAERSMELGCGSGSLSTQLYAMGSTREVEGVDISPERVAQAEIRRNELGAPGGFRVEDANRVVLEPGRYDLIVSSHSFHHFLDLERVMVQVLEALTPRGLFILEEYVGPTQFQWSEAQMAHTKDLLATIPERYRKLKWDAWKTEEGRPDPMDVVAGSPFESIRSAEIGPLFDYYFDVVHRRLAGGTIQHLLYNGIMHNFRPDDPEAEALARRIWEAEDALIDSGRLPSDFQILIGRRPRT